MPHNKQPARVVARPAGLESIVDGAAVSVLIPGSRAPDKRLLLTVKRNRPGARRTLLVRLGPWPEFSIHAKQLLDRDRFRNVAITWIGKVIIQSADPCAAVSALLDLPEQAVWRHLTGGALERIVSQDDGGAA